MNHPKELKHTLQMQSQESDLYQTILKCHSLKIESIQIYNGPWIDIEVVKSGRSQQCSVRMHSRDHKVLETNLQIRFEFGTRDRLRVLLGDLFGPNSKGQPMAKELLTVVWDSDTGEGDSSFVSEEIRAALAFQMHRILTELKVGIVRASEVVNSSFNPRAAGETALEIVTLRRQIATCEHVDSSEEF